MREAIHYLSNTSESTNKLHLFLIGFGLVWYLVAIITTWVALTGYGVPERDPLAFMAFEHLGMIPTFLIVFVLVTIIMIYIPYRFRNNKHIGIACNTAFVVFFLLDGGHDAAIMLNGNNIILDILFRITENIMACLGI